MNKIINRLPLILVLITVVPVSEARTFTIKHNSCSSAPMAYEVLRSKKPIKITNYTYNPKDAYIESGTVNVLSEKQVKLDDSNGKVQVIITQNIAKDGKYRPVEYFFNQKTFCVIAEDKKCYSVPEDVFYSKHFGIQMICSNTVSLESAITRIPPARPNESYVGAGSTVVGGTPLTPVYESKIVPANY